jgi:hypothetical protein
MTTQTVTAPTVGAPAGSAPRPRLAVVAAVLAGTAIVGVVGTLLWPPTADGNWYHYADVAPVRDRFFAVLSVLAVSLILSVPAQAIAAMALARQRGAGWATWGAVIMWVGAALQAAGAAGWAMTYYFATGPGLDPAAGTAFLDHVYHDGHVFALAMPGSLMVAIGTVVQAVGLWRSRSLPRWVPLLTLVIVPTFVLPNDGPAGLITQVPLSVAMVALGWYAWRRAA